MGGESAPCFRYVAARQQASSHLAGTGQTFSAGDAQAEEAAGIGGKQHGVGYGDHAAVVRAGLAQVAAPCGAAGGERGDRRDVGDFFKAKGWGDWVNVLRVKGKGMLAEKTTTENSFMFELQLV